MNRHNRPVPRLTGGTVRKASQFDAVRTMQRLLFVALVSAGTVFAQLGPPPGPNDRFVVSRGMPTTSVYVLYAFHGPVELTHDAHSYVSSPEPWLHRFRLLTSEGDGIILSGSIKHTKAPHDEDPNPDEYTYFTGIYVPGCIHSDFLFRSAPPHSSACLLGLEPGTNTVSVGSRSFLHPPLGHRDNYGAELTVQVSGGDADHMLLVVVGVHGGVPFWMRWLPMAPRDLLTCAGVFPPRLFSQGCPAGAGRILVDTEAGKLYAFVGFQDPVHNSQVQRVLLRRGAPDALPLLDLAPLGTMESPDTNSTALTVEGHQVNPQVMALLLQQENQLFLSVDRANGESYVGRLSPQACAQPTTQVRATPLGPVTPMGGNFQARHLVENLSPETLDNVSLVFEGLPPGVLLTNADGHTIPRCLPGDSPYLALGRLFPGERRMVTANFQGQPTQFSTRLLQGGDAL